VYTVSCREGPNINGHCPSVDALFESVATEAGANALGVLLTGMGRDGARGLLQMRRGGAGTLAQDEASSVVFGMPKEAFEMGAVDTVTPLNQMTGKIIENLQRINA
jgi:two-component system chemotaxis response regulator CheB